MRGLSARQRVALGTAAAALGAAVLLFIVVTGWRRDFRVPFSFSGDALEYLMQSKGTIENGWWWVHPRLSAPGTFWQVDYPSATNVDQAIVWIVHLFTRDPGLCINIAWMVMIVLSAVIATCCLRVIGVSSALAVLAGWLYAFAPYGLYRNITHFSLATYLVPVPCVVALLVAAGRVDDLSAAAKRWLAVVCALIGLNYIYNAFFAAFLILLAALITLAARRSLLQFAQGTALVGIICLATTISLAPTFYSWSLHGRPIVLPVKHAAESEQYGLKIRQLVSPVLDSRLPPFHYWNELETRARFPLEDENRNSRLGVVGTAGFLLLLIGLLVAATSSLASEPMLFEYAGRLTLALLLLGTIGGFGSLFSLLVSPEIRAYNRVTPFITFFALAALAMVGDKWLVVGEDRGRWPGHQWRAAGAIALVAVLGFLDESDAAIPLNRRQEEARRDWQSTASFVSALEALLPAGAMVFQLPVLTYLDDLGHEKMLPFDHIRPYLLSKSVHFSYPALSDPIVRWQRQVGRLPTPALPAALGREGFSAIVLDRDGYRDRGTAVLHALTATALGDPIIAANERYVAVYLRRLSAASVPAGVLPHLNAAVTPATTDVPVCRADTFYNLEWVGDASPPSNRTPVRVPRSGGFQVTGWAVDRPGRMAAADLDMFIDGKFVTTSYFGLDRPDVATYLQDPVFRPSGFTARIAGRELGAGVCLLTLRILSGDRSCYYEGPRVAIQAQ